MFQAHLRSPDELARAVWKLVDEDINIFQDLGYPIDPLSSPVVYMREPKGQNYFYNVNDMLRLGWGDCEDLSAWLIAFLLVTGANARPLLLPQTPPLWHVSTEVCLNNRWKQIDLSKLKGM